MSNTTLALVLAAGAYFLMSRSGGGGALALGDPGPGAGVPTVEPLPDGAVGWGIVDGRRVPLYDYGEGPVPRRRRGRWG